MPGVMQPGPKKDSLGQLVGAANTVMTIKGAAGSFGGGAPSNQDKPAPDAGGGEPEYKLPESDDQKARRDAMDRRLKMSMGPNSGGY